MADRGEFGGGPGQELPQLPPSLLQMAQGIAPSGQGDDPYGGRTLAEILIGGAPDMGAGGPGYGAADGQRGGGGFAPDWGSQPATHEQVAAGIQRGGRYQPEFARTLQSGGPEGGWFSIPGTQTETIVPWGMHDNSDEKNPAPGLFGMSTNNWRLLPRGWQTPGNVMRAGHVVDSRWTDKPLGYVNYRGGGEPPFGTGGPGHGFPVSAGSSNQRGYFFPGQIEPWITEGGPGTT